LFRQPPAVPLQASPALEPPAAGPRRLISSRTRMSRCDTPRWRSAARGNLPS
jgi:hypothetical protein